MHFLYHPPAQMDSQNEWSRELDRNIKLVSGLVSDGISLFCLCDTLDGKINPPYL